MKIIASEMDPGIQIIKMKAVICTKYLPPEVLQIEEVEKLFPKENEVLIKVKATTAHIGDTEIRRLEPGLGPVTDFFFKPLMRFIVGFKGPRKKILGMELAGDLEAVGKDITLFKIGDPVFKSTEFRSDTYAHYCFIPENSPMKALIFFPVFLFFASVCFAQDNCNCEQALKQIIQKIETEYPGFHEKSKDRLVYNNLKENLLNKARSTHDTACIGMLRAYKDFFKDGHLTITRIETEEDGNQIRSRSNKISISPEEFHKRLLTTTDPMEGVWKSGSYKVGIVRQGKVYHGFIIEADTAWWKPGEIKFTLSDDGKAGYYMRDHSLSNETYELVDGWILYFNFSKFIKELPRPNLPESEIQSKLTELDGCYFKMVTEKTALLCLSSFEQSYVERIKNMLAENRMAIEGCENLIIDVRNNPGGVYEAYADLFPYLLTNKVRGMGMEFKVTQTLIDGIQDWYDDEVGKKMAREWIGMFEGKIGEFVNTDTTDISILEIIPAEKSPKQVVILANRRTASSGEAFLMDARQSKKVKILGTPTYGALDYGSASIFSFGCKNYKLMMPTWRSMRLPDYPIDNIGIQPDIYLDKSVKDWIRYAVDYLENN